MKEIKFMSAVATMNMGFTYNQVLGLTMQMDEASRLKLYRALGKGLHTVSLRAIHQRNQMQCDMSIDDVVAECKAVRQQRFIRISHTSPRYLFSFGR